MKRDPILDQVFGLYALGMKTALVTAFAEGLAWPIIVLMLAAIAGMGLAFQSAMRILRRYP